MTPAETLTAAADRLDALAKGATSGPWEHTPGGGESLLTRVWSEGDLVAKCHTGHVNTDADLIATLDPITAGLLAEVLRGEAIAEAMRRNYGFFPFDRSMIALAEHILRDA